MFPAAQVGIGNAEAEVPEHEHEQSETTSGMIVDYFQRVWQGGVSAGDGAREGGRS